MKKKFKFMGIYLSDANISDIVNSLENRKSIFVTFVNPVSFSLTKKVVDYIDCINRFDYVLSDGFLISLLFRLKFFVSCPRISFDSTSLANYVFEHSIAHRKSIVLVGAKPGVALKAKENFISQYNGLKIVACFSGYGDDVATANNFIINNNVDIVICGMGAPNQEKFLMNLKDSSWQGAAFTCGGYIDQSSNSYIYYPEFVNKLNIRFLFRMYKEPKRLIFRYFFDYVPFIINYMKFYLKGGDK
jgi:N-acetylglucosaminyldiphosphoundecaprenol N-acetyl-beta-D-mannosaminyltransferase